MAGRDDGPEMGSEEAEVNPLEKLMKERFGSPEFGTLMDSIVDQMFKNMAEVKPEDGEQGRAKE